MGEKWVVGSVPRHARLWRALFILASLGSFYVALRPQGGAAHWFAYADKVLHAGAFAVLALLSLKTGWLKIWQAFVVLSMLGLFIEIAQSMTTHRTADVLDWVADMAGSSIALASWWVFQYRSFSAR
jgi:VanZ family protein